MDTQSVKSTEVGGPERGVDGGKKVKGRKRHLLADTCGLLITAVVHAANTYDGTGAERLLEATRQRGIRLRKIWVDQTYRGTLRQWEAGVACGCVDGSAAPTRIVFRAQWVGGALGRVAHGGLEVSAQFVWFA